MPRSALNENNCAEKNYGTDTQFLRTKSVQASETLSFEVSTNHHLD